MADHNQALLDHEVVTREEAQRLAGDIVAWLIDAGIVENRPHRKEHDTGVWYPPGPRATEACVPPEPRPEGEPSWSWLDYADNDLRVLSEPGFILNYQGNHHDVACPCCGKRSDFQILWDAGFEWMEGGPGTAQCEHCGKASPLPNWSHPDGGFVMLGFDFWNWGELSETFLDALRRRLGHRTTFLFGKR